MCAADFIKAGSDIVSVHAEQASTVHLHRVVNMVSYGPALRSRPASFLLMLRF